MQKLGKYGKIHRKGSKLLRGWHRGLSEHEAPGVAKGLVIFMKPINETLVEEVRRLVPVLGVQGILDKALNRMQQVKRLTEQIVITKMIQKGQMIIVKYLASSLEHEIFHYHQADHIPRMF